MPGQAGLGTLEAIKAVCRNEESTSTQTTMLASMLLRFGIPFPRNWPKWRKKNLQHNMKENVKATDYKGEKINKSEWQQKVKHPTPRSFQKKRKEK